MFRLTDAVIQLEREIMQQKEKLNSSSTELRIMIRWYIIVVKVLLLLTTTHYYSLNTDKIRVESLVLNCYQLLNGAIYFAFYYHVIFLLHTIII